MSALTLYRLNGPPDPLTLAVRAWVILCEIPNYTEVPSGYFWNSAGPLPVLLYKHHLIVREKILDFLRLAFNLDSDLPAPSCSLSSLIIEECYSKLHPSTLFALFSSETPPKGLLDAETPWLESLLSLPLSKLRFAFERHRLTHFFSKQHDISSEASALHRCDEAHSTLSSLLGEKPFFASQTGLATFPRSADIVVYAYLKYELQQLPTHPHVASSLAQHPNLLGLVQRVEDTLRAKASAARFPVPEIGYNLLQTGDRTEYLCGRVYQSPIETADQQWGRIVYQLGGEEPRRRTKNSTNSVDKGYIVGVAAVLFVFLYFKT
jgi:glutathione S-transferase